MAKTKSTTATGATFSTRENTRLETAQMAGATKRSKLEVLEDENDAENGTSKDLCDYITKHAGITRGVPAPTNQPT